MALYIVIYRSEEDVAISDSVYLYEKLNLLYPARVRSYNNGLCINVDPGVLIDIRYGDYQALKIRGIRADYYYTYSENVSTTLKQSGGKRLNDFEDIIHIINFYMWTADSIDKYLKVKEDK